MHQFKAVELHELFLTILQQNLPDGAFTWLTDKSRVASSGLPAAFGALPRKTGKNRIRISEDQLKTMQTIRPGLDIRHWSIDRLSRVWLLFSLDSADKEQYFKMIEGLFRASEVNEMVALYSALPVLAYPDMWTSRCSEGIRSNIGDVLEAIMCRNPYPSENLSQAAWNQLVLKAFFTDKPVGDILGLHERANATLARILSDYAHERWAAHRDVNPQLWRCVGKFIDAESFADLKRIVASTDPLEKEAAFLACYDSSYGPAQLLLTPDRISAIESGKSSWSKLAEKIKDHVLQP